MKTKKVRRHSGRVTPQVIKPDMKYSEIKEQALEPKEVYDDWENYRDGFRDKKYLKWKEIKQK